MSCWRRRGESWKASCPWFVSTIEQELKNSRDVLSIVENYKKNAGEEFANELEILAADMRSSSYEARSPGLRPGSTPHASDVVRG